LVSVTVLVELAAPTTTEPKFTLLGDAVTGALPFPVRLTICGLVLASSVNVSVPVAAPSATGLKVTLIVQFAPAAIAPTQLVLLIANGSEAATAEMFRGQFSLFVKVSDFAALVMPTTTELKLNGLAENVTGSDPVPLRFTVCGLVRAE
jgi:hypothetical protein